MSTLGVCRRGRGLPLPALQLGLVLAICGLVQAGMGSPRSASPLADTAISKDGLAIAYDVKGEGQPALVFVHDWACNRGFWRAQMDYFSGTHQVIALDLAGCGESGKGRDAYTIESFADDVAAVIEKLNLTSVVLVGHSMGGLVSIRAARALGDKVIGIIGVDSLQDMSETRSAALLERTLKPFKDDFKSATQAFARSLFSEKADPALVERVVSEMSSVSPDVGLSSLRSEALFSLRADLEGLRLPIRVINSDRFPTNVAANKAIFRNYEMIPMNGVGHYVMLEDAPRFDKLLEDVLIKFEAR